MSFLPKDKELEYYALIRKIESGGNDLAKNPLSTASGRYQPIKSTWTAYGLPWSQVFDVALQERFIRSFTADNARALMKSGCAVNFATLYGAHFLGANGLLKTMRGKPSDSITTVTTTAQRKANPSILGSSKTVKDFCDWLERKTGDSVYKRYTNAPEIVPVPKATKPTEKPQMNWTNNLVIKTVIQYALTALGGFFVNNGSLDPSQWETIAGAVMILIGVIPGAFASATEKLMLGGKVAKISELNPGTIADIASEIGAKK